jgi:hypothetical protein
MAKRKKRKPMPKWIWQLNCQILNYKLKHLLSYIWWCGDKGCRDWNYRIAKRFTVSDRTIRRWIKALADMRLIYINFPCKRSRTIYRRPYFSMDMWLFKRGLIKELPKKKQVIPTSAHRRTEVAYISNAQRYNQPTVDDYNAVQRRKAEKQRSGSPQPAATRPGPDPSKTSIAGGLSCPTTPVEKIGDVAARKIASLMLGNIASEQKLAPPEE